MRGRTGVAIIQWSQLCTVLGGVAGYLLCANVYVAALVPPEERTASFGILQGTCMLGISLGYMGSSIFLFFISPLLLLSPPFFEIKLIRKNLLRSVGGYLGDIFGDLAPFIFTTVLFILAATLTTFLPHVAPPVKPSSSDDEERGTGIFSFLAPFRVFVPRIIEPEDGGHKQRYWGMTLVGIGTFTGVLAVSYVPFLLQLTATNAYGFHAKEVSTVPSSSKLVLSLSYSTFCLLEKQNGVLLSLNSFCRAIFLTSIFPRIIASGRKWYTTSSLPSPSSPLTPPATEEGITSVEPIAILGEASSEPASVPSRTDVGHGSKFDLTFVTFSMLLDGTLTALTMLASSGSHLYLAAAILPFASGTAPACKGVVLALVPKHHQSDALAAVALLEMSATVATVALFGQIFAWLSELGWARYTFALNAILALISATVYTYVRFPPEERTPDSKIDVGGV